MTKKECTLIEKIALNKHINGSMSRITYLCMTKDRNQTELSRLLGTNISNISANVKKLIKMQVINRKKVDGVVLYTINWDWDCDFDPNQLDLEDLGYRMEE